MTNPTAIVHFPRLPLFSAIALVSAVVIGVAASRIGGLPAAPGLEPVAAVDSRMLLFEDGASGSVIIRDGTSQAIVATVAPGTNGFLRGVLRGLMRARKQEGTLRTAPFRLDRLANGQLILTDTNDQVQLDLNAFGQTNAAVFSAFLTKQGDDKP
jgi:putative photosynthetic complex assembly protein